MTTATLLLPATERLKDAALPPGLARALARADHCDHGGGEAQQLLRHFRISPDVADWPVAALTRQRDAGDAAGHLWLRADPCFIAPDIQGVRLLAHGPALALEAGEATSFVEALQPVFAEHGFELSAPEPSRWYVRLPVGVTLPALTPVDAVLGDDLFEHLPAGDEGRIWRALLSDTQVILHQLPLNAQRQAVGKAMVNSLWFWGAGILPQAVFSVHGQVRSPDPLLMALASLAVETQASQQLVDLRHLRDPAVAVAQALMPLLDALQKGELQALVLDFADGQHYRLSAAQRWRWWRRGQASLVR